MNILAISGSLRAGSSNTLILRSAFLVAPAGVNVSLYEALEAIPPFNQDREDLDANLSPAPVVHLRQHIRASDAVLISSPEYAHGVSGVLKNALDWLVGSGELIDKPVGLINAAPRSVHAHANLMEILRMVTGREPIEGLVREPLANKPRTAEAYAADPTIGAVVLETIEGLRRAKENP